MSFLIDNWDRRPSAQPLHKSAALNFAKEFTGLGDMQRGFQSLGQGNILKGVGQLGLGGLIAGSMFIPGVGWAARGLLAAGKGARAATLGTKALQAGTSAAKAGTSAAKAGNVARGVVNPAKNVRRYRKASRYVSQRGGQARAAGNRSVRQVNQQTRFGGRHGADGKPFKDYMNNPNLYSQNPTTGFGPGNIMRNVKEFVDVGIRGTKNQVGFRSANPSNFSSRLRHNMGMGVNDRNIRTAAGRYAARSPFVSSGVVTAGTGLAVNAGTGGPPEDNVPDFLQGFDTAGMAAGQYEKPYWLQ